MAEQYGGKDQFISPEHALASGMLAAALMHAGFSVTAVYDDDGEQKPVLVIADDTIPWSFRIRIEEVS